VLGCFNPECDSSNQSRFPILQVVLGFFSTEEYFGTSGMMDMNGKRRRMGRPLMKPMSASRFVHLSFVEHQPTVMSMLKIFHKVNRCVFANNSMFRSNQLDKRIGY
jgi:hypothetical protein